ncbi:MAG: hydroxyacylglutathione hydrolase [Pseudanabaenaceae cyanobacterium SKYGB_i_bin29]|nr:hydroxyacylglutathione hydrolase [Pseudanabaenaceae cyanobacterium SKYG29]MDW8420679.1 hydroxyacylglutathione hydrolase [Pseudanabaenaceae cyanobacterium SKYGB_i_bin29]
MAFAVHCLPALKDNYIFLLHDPDRAEAAVVDPAIAEPVLSKLAELGAKLVAIFNTHHHSDHVGGNRDLLSVYPQATVYGGAADKGRIPGQTVFLQENDRVTFGGEEAEILFIPGHTRGHIAYYFPQSGHLFCGDTLFSGGCGRLFEGTPSQMVQSLSKLRQLPEATQVWCAHEYTLNNLKFALTVDPDNYALRARFQVVQEMRANYICTIPSTIGLEKAINPFLRWDTPAIQAATGYTEPDRVFGKLRGMKDLYVA